MPLPDYRLGKNSLIMKDHDTSYLIECFRRRGKVVCYLVNKDTYEFVKLLTMFYFQYVGVFNACDYEDIGKRLHVECHNAEEIVPSNYNSVHDLYNDLENKADDLADKCDGCFRQFNAKGYVYADDEDWFARSKEGNIECYYNRCNNNNKKVEGW